MKRVSILLIVVFLVSFPISVQGVTASSFLIMEAETQKILDQENGETKLPMASTTKIMTALVVLENTSLHEEVRISSQAVGIEGSSLYIKTNEIYTVEELLCGLMLRSANDCAVALAGYVGEKVGINFIDLMNAKAIELNLKNTHFMNPHGLPAKGHFTTAKELAITMAEAMKNEDFCRITSLKRVKIKDQTIANHNRLLFTYQGCIGGKTGYTIEAGRCLVSVAEKDEVKLICVTLGKRDDWNIHSTAYDEWFAKGEKVELCKCNSFTVDLPMASGGIIKAINNEKVDAVLFEYDGECDTRIRAMPFIYGNKDVGDVVGCVEFVVDGKVVGMSSLVLCDSITVEPKKELLISRLFHFFKRFFLKYT